MFIWVFPGHRYTFPQARQIQRFVSSLSTHSLFVLGGQSHVHSPLAQCLALLIRKLKSAELNDGDNEKVAGY